MSLLDLFRKKGSASAANEPESSSVVPASGPVSVPAAPAPESVVQAAPPQAEAGDAGAAQGAEPTVRIFDEFGREMLIPASQWRRELLPQALEQAKNQPDALAQILMDATQLGAAGEVVAAAAHLQSLDPVAERGATVHGLVLLGAGQPAAAEDVFVTYLGQIGPSAGVLAHLARAQAMQNRMEEADATLWRALEADPNNDSAVGLYAARSREVEGEFGWQSALERAATLPGAWLPLLWLGRGALDARNRSLAVALYKQALERGGRPAPVALLQGVSGDLGQYGLLEDALRLSRPAFVPEVHGLAVGNNLIKATLDNGQPAEALGLVRELGKLNRPEFAEALRSWEIEIRRRELQAQAASQAPEPALLQVQGPVWLPPGSPGRELYAREATRRAKVLFLGSSVTLPAELPQEAAQLPDMAGRLSRAVPLFLAEGAFTLLGLDTVTLVPWAETAGFAMLGQPWPDDAAAVYARDAGAGAAVSGHVVARPEGAEVTLRIVRAAAAEAASSGDGAAGAAVEPVDEAASNDAGAVVEPEAGAELSGEPVTITVSMAWPELYAGAQSLWAQLAHQLVSRFGDAPEPPKPGRYTPPRGEDLNAYLRLLEQLLGINCASSSRYAQILLSGEREAVRGLIDLAVRYPNSLPVRLMLGEVLLRLRGLHPAVMAECAGPVQLLQERHPLPDPEAAHVVQGLLRAALSAQPSTPAQER